MIIEKNNNNFYQGIHIVMSCDDNYIEPLVTTLISIEKSYKSKRPVKISILSMNVDTLKQKKIKSIFNFDINFYDIESLMPDYLPISFFPSKMVFARLWMEKVFGDSQRVLYIDADLIFIQDISELFFWDLNDKPIACCLDSYIDNISHPMGLEYWSDLSHDPFSNYFNSGVMIIDTKKWMSMDILNNSLEIIKKYGNRIKLVDQEVLNAIFLGNFEIIDFRWNQQTMVRIDATTINQNVPGNQIYHAITRPAVVHFNSMMSDDGVFFKPWIDGSPDPYARLWQKFYKEAISRLS